MKVSGLNCLFGILLMGMISLIIGCNAGANQGADMTGDSIQKVQVKTLLKTTQSWNGSPLPDYESEHPEITALSITIPPNTKLPVHRHPVINAGMLLRGELTVISEAGDTLQMQAGDVIAEMVNQWHHGENNGTEPAEILVFYSGNVDKPITVLRDSVETNHSGH